MIFLKKFSKYFNVKLMFYPKFTSLKHLISRMDFTAIKYSGQGSFKVKKGTIDFFFIFTENHRHLPIASVNDP